MISGTMRKRAARDSCDPDIQNKRVMDVPSFSVHKAEPSRQHLMSGASLDPRRAESSRQHVRALNSQFASWITLQLQNHPEELWEDGVKDYLSHASHIMEKFKDVVDWLRTNVASSGITTVGPPSDKNNFVAVAENNKTNLRFDKNNGFAQAAPSTCFPSFQNTGVFSSSQSLGVFSTSQNSGVFSTSQNSGVFSTSQNSGVFSTSQNSGLFSSSQSTQTPAFLGSQSSTTSTKVEASGDIDEGNDLEQPSSPSLKKTEEKGIVIVHEAKCKVYVKPDNPADNDWKDIGVGHLSIKCKEGAGKSTKESKPIIVIRNDVGKILLNALIYPGIKMNIQKKTIASIFHTSGGDNEVAVARTYLLRMKTEEETTQLSKAIKEYAPSA